MTEKQKNLLILGVMLLLAVASVFIIWPPSEKTKLGLDLQGGLEVILEAPADVTGDQMDQAELVVRNRVDKLGVSEPSISRQGNNQISVGLAGVKDVEEATALIGKTALLEFKQVDNKLTDEILTGAKTEAQLAPDKQLLHETARDSNGDPIRDENALRERYPASPDGTDSPFVTYNITNKFLESGQPARIPWVVNREPLMTGAALQEAKVGIGQFNKPQVDMTFTDEGTKQFEAATQKLSTAGTVTKTISQMAIVLDDEVQSAPTVQEPIKGNQAVITGTMPRKEIEQTVLVLNTGALPVELETVDKNEISATLGKDSLRQGLVAGAIGLALVMIFMLFYYRLLGVVADIALIFYGLLFYAALSNPWYPATLTLPGIAGMILTVGVAADANVVIFERIKEEVQRGKTIRSAVNSGYTKGFKTILDANAVTVITAAIIFFVATAGVKGFALTLMIGVVISMFTAVLATRAMLALLANWRIFNNPMLMGIKPEKHKADKK